MSLKIPVPSVSSSFFTEIWAPSNIASTKTFIENEDSKRHLLDLSWPKIYFFRNILFLFFKIESWSFQHMFKIKFRETSQNFNSFRQFIFPFFLSVVCLSWNFVRFHEILFQTDAESFSFLSWKTKKFYSRKKKFKPLSISKQISFVYWINFPGRFSFVLRFHCGCDIFAR